MLTHICSASGWGTQTRTLLACRPPPWHWHWHRLPAGWRCCCPPAPLAPASAQSRSGWSPGRTAQCHTTAGPGLPPGRDARWGHGSHPAAIMGATPLRGGGRGGRPPPPPPPAPARPRPPPPPPPRMAECCQQLLQQSRRAPHSSSSSQRHARPGSCHRTPSSCTSTRTRAAQRAPGGRPRPAGPAARPWRCLQCKGRQSRRRSHVWMLSAGPAARKQDPRVVRATSMQVGGGWRLLCSAAVRQ
jgi:hypothetical protein